MAELYFESLEGAGNPARFTPMNEDVRAAFRQEAGFDPKLLFDPRQSSRGERIRKACGVFWTSVPRSPLICKAIGSR